MDFLIRYLDVWVPRQITLSSLPACHGDGPCWCVTGDTAWRLTSERVPLTCECELTAAQCWCLGLTVKGKERIREEGLLLHRRSVPYQGSYL